MCGFVAAQYSDPSRASPAKKMIAKLRHRGPDEEGFWSDEESGVHFSQCRLSIIDLDGGKQPMTREGHSIIYNGEIYNYQKLRSELRDNGMSFNTDSDTEVFLQGFRYWGTDVFDRVRGMFSLAIWDKQNKRMVLARDHLGQKPLFYYSDEDKFLAASELQGLLTDTDIPRSADFASLSWYLSLGYIPSPRTGFSKVKKLPPGKYMLVEDSQIKDQVRYWDPSDYTDTTKTISNPTNKVRSTVTEAVKRRLVSDVPLGAFLSGGIDSSVITGVMQEHTNQPVRTVSIGFTDDLYDETNFARTVAESLGTDHSEYKLSIDLTDVLPNLVDHFGEPFADSSAVPTYYLAKKTRESVKVSLSGDGGDEVFGGYRRYLAMRKLMTIKKYTPAPILNLLQSGANLLGTPSDRRSKWGERLRILRMIAQNEVEQYLSMVGLGAENLKSWLAKGPLKRPASRGGEEWLERWFRRYSHIDDPASRAMAVDLCSYLPGDLQVKTDITTMMNSLECRSPFLDRDVVELGLQVESNQKINGNNLKHILKKAFQDMLPDEVINRSKQGFGVPLKDWFRKGKESQYLEKILRSKQSNFDAVIERASTEQLLDKHQNGQIDAGPILWALTMMKLWMDRYSVRV